MYYGDMTTRALHNPVDRIDMQHTMQYTELNAPIVTLNLQILCAYRSSKTQRSRGLLLWHVR